MGAWSQGTDFLPLWTFCAQIPSRWQAAGTIALDIGSLGTDSPSVEVLDSRDDSWLPVVTSAMDHARESFVVTTGDLADPRILYVNRAFTRITGYAPEEVLGQNPNLLQGPDTDREVLRRLKASLGAGEVFAGETYNYRRDGSRFVMSWTALPVRCRRGEVSHFVAVQRDATLQHEAERLQRILATVKHVADALILVDLQGRVLDVNPAFLELSGLREDQAVGAPLDSLGLGPRSLQVKREILLAFKHQTTWQGSYENRRARGEPSIISVSISPAQGADGRTSCFVVSARDITEHRRLESVAESLNMVENLGYVFSGIRHELGNPVNSIKTALTVLQDGLAGYSQAEVASYLERILTEVGRVEYLLKTLRSYTAFERPRCRELDLAAFVRDFERLSQPDASRRGVSLAVDVEAEVVARADSRALQQVLLNLLANAIDATEREPDPEVRIAVRRAGNWVCLSVTDNGAGIPPGRLGDVWRPFFTTKTTGTGLGLVLVKKLVTSMGGTIEVASRPGSGTIFDVFLDTVDRPKSLIPRAAPVSTLGALDLSPGRVPKLETSP